MRTNETILIPQSAIIINKPPNAELKITYASAISYVKYTVQRKQRHDMSCLCCFFFIYKIVFFANVFLPSVFCKSFHKNIEKTTQNDPNWHQQVSFVFDSMQGVLENGFNTHKVATIELNIGWGYDVSDGNGAPQTWPKQSPSLFPLSTKYKANIKIYYHFSPLITAAIAKENEEQPRPIDGLVHDLVRLMNAKDRDDQTVEIATKKNTEPVDEILGQEMYRAENAVHRVK